MKKSLGLSAGLCFAFTSLFLTAPAVSAQDQPGMAAPPKVLEITVEDLKPGQSGSPHMKTEGAFVQAFKSADWSTHYIGMDSLTGPSRAVFFVPYGSFEAWQKDLEATMKNATLSAAIDSASIADGALLGAYETSAYTLRDDLSLRAPVPMDHFHFVEITLFTVRPGHGKDWNDLVKMYIAAYQKIPNAHWATFEKRYGTNSGSRYIAVTPMKSMAEADQEMLDDNALVSTVSSEDRQKMRELTAAAIESISSSIYAVNPKMSYPYDAWVKADPAFWTPQ